MSRCIVWQRFALLGASCVRLLVLDAGVADPAEPIDHVSEGSQESYSILISEEDVLSRVPSV